MNRGDGLVQRRRVVNSGGSGGGSGQDGSNADLVGHNDKLSGQSPDSDCLSQKDLNCNPTIDDESDKETRLTLMEEVLLLGLKDKEVHLRPRNPPLFYEFLDRPGWRLTFCPLFHRDTRPFGTIA